MHTLSQRLAAEAFGTFWLVFGGCGAWLFILAPLIGGLLAGASYGAPGPDPGAAPGSQAGAAR